MDDKAFKGLAPHRWVYNKLDIALRLGYECGINGDTFLSGGKYVVRPIVNLEGMGKGTGLIVGKKGDTAVIPPGHFFCKYFEGTHLTIDYINGEPQVPIIGEKLAKRIDRFTKWYKADTIVPTPPLFLQNVLKEVHTVNLEYIGGNLIEVHLRGNPDFKGHTSDYVKVVHDFKDTHPEHGETFISRPDGSRKGFYIKGDIL